MRPSLFFAVFSGFLLVCTGCGDDRDARDSKTLYGCSTKTDCLTGYDCVCGWCQVPGSTIVCDASASSSGGTDAGSSSGTTDTGSSGGTTDTGSSGGTTDTGSSGGTTDSGSSGGLPDNCNVQTWSPCPSGYGCYYDATNKKGFCDKHGNKQKNEACSHGAGPECGKDGTTPMLCDSVDSKCYTLCDAIKGGPCPAGLTCYALTEPDQSAWPDNAGICAP